jgi:2-(1,2-epoxy-1,2-dihydrophenyl)acetyl-CoA isomerase
MPTTDILYEVDGNVAVVTVSNPGKLNTMSGPMQQKLLAALEQVRADRTIRALLLTGAGKAFCVGAALSEFAAVDNDDGPSLGNRIAYTMETVSNRLVTELRELPVPVVCALNGAVAGAGVGLVLAADVVIAARSAYFYLPFIPRLGIVPDLGATWILPRLLGRARATALTLLGDRLPAEQAAQWGLILSCVDDGVLLNEARSIARRLAALPAYAALETRRAFDAGDRNSFTSQLDYERERQRELIDRETFAEGVQAFMEKREPIFPGR